MELVPFAELPEGDVCAAVRRAYAKSPNRVAFECALALAKQMDNWDRLSGSGMASVARQLREILRALERDEPRPLDFLDELRARRLARTRDAGIPTKGAE